MTKTMACAVFVGVLLMGGVIMRTGAAQDRTPQPGQPTQARVWVQNRGDAEAVPVSVQAMASSAPPLRVELIGTPTVAVGGPIGQVGAARQPWEYRDVTIPSGQDPTALLNAAGSDGWEATGLAFPAQGGTLLVMKRPR